MSYLVMLLPVLVVVGAFMWMQPSTRDKRLAKLRSNALLNGFRMTSIKVHDNSEYGRINQIKQIVTVYELALESIGEGSAVFTVQRTEGESGAFLPERWAWEDRKNLTDEQYQALHDLLLSLPTMISVLTLRSDSIGLCWDESDENIAYSTLKEPMIACAHIFNRKVL